MRHSRHDVSECGQEKAPNLVANAISSVEFNNSAVSRNLQYSRKLFYAYNN